MSVIRLDKFIANAGIGTRSEVKKYLKYRRIWVDGIVELKGEKKINPEVSIVTFDKRIITYDKFCYIMLNKPKNVICATEDEEHKTVIDLLGNEFKNKNLFSVGRLDKDTVGLVIITNDGGFAYKTLSPKKHVIKKYFAYINGIVTQEHVKIFKDGVKINGESGYKCLPANLEILYSKDNFSKINIEIREGKFHQIKKMFISIGRKVIYLKRIKFGEIELDETLEEGQYRYLNDNEMEVIKKYL